MWTGVVNGTQIQYNVLDYKMPLVWIRFVSCGLAVYTIYVGVVGGFSFFGGSRHSSLSECGNKVQD